MTTPRTRRAAGRSAGAPRVLCVRLDSLGDVLVTGPAVRDVAAGAASVTVLAGPAGAAAARLLPGVDEVLEWSAPWILADPPPVSVRDTDALVADLRDRRFDAAVVFTSYHQSPLPTALLLRLAGVPRISAISEDYPGSLLDVRHRLGGGGGDEVDLPEPERARSLAAAAGFPAADDGGLAVRRPLPDVSALVPARPYVVLHPGATAPARRWPLERFAAAAQGLERAGWTVVVTGTADERPLTAAVARAAGPDGVDLGGRTSLAETAAVLDGAAAVVVANTGPAHLAAAVGTPVVSLFAPVVPAARWAPYGVPTVLLGDPTAACAGTRARECPVVGHPCLTSVRPDEVVDAVGALAGVLA